MNEPTEEQLALAERLKLLDKGLKIQWTKEGVASQIDGIIPIRAGENIEESVRFFLMEYSKLFGMKKDLSDLKFIGKLYGLGTVNIKYQQHHEDIPVLHALTSIHLNKESKIIKIKNNYYPVIPLDTESILSRGISKEKAIEITNLFLDAEAKCMCDCFANLVIYPKDEKFYLTWEVCVSLRCPPGCYNVYVNVEDGNVLHKIDVLKRTDGKGRVFIPNPVVALRDRNLNPELNIPEKAYTTVVLKDLDGSGFLRGPYADTGDTQNRACEPSLIFNYKRGDSKFCEVMAYYHIDSFQRYIQKLGFKDLCNICNRQLKVNAYVKGGYNSYYDPHTKTLAFGGGGIPDAEDADIIIHEYGHALQDNQVPGFGMTDECCAMGQGFGDFLAACFFADINDGFNRECVGDWNGIERIGDCVSRVDSKKHYPEDFLGVMNCGADSEIWSAVLWDMYLALGGKSKKKEKRIKAKDRSITLVIESHFFLNPLSQFIEGADAIITANKLLYEGMDEEKIRAVFIKRGILA